MDSLSAPRRLLPRAVDADACGVRLSVPGKVILMGEHAAVHGRPAVVAAVDLRLVVEARTEPEGRASRRGRVLLDLPDVGSARELSWQEIEALANRARRRWYAFLSGDEPFRTNRDRGDLACIAVGEALASLAPTASVRLRERSLELRLRSAIPVGAGLGSSSAAAVGVVAAVRAVAHGLGRAARDAGHDASPDTGHAGPDAGSDAGREQRRERLIARTARAGAAGEVFQHAVDPIRAGMPPHVSPGAARDALPHAVGGKEILAELQAIEAAALEVERRQHGLPSGIDSGTVLRGGVLCVRSTSPHTSPETRRKTAQETSPDTSRETKRKASQELRFERLPRRAWLRNRLLIMDSGAPNHATGAVVAAVRRRYERDPERVAEALDRIGAAAEAFREALVRDREPQAAAAVAAGHRGLLDLGVVPAAIAVRIRRIEAAGGAAKISGAGALEGDCAGALICMLDTPSASTRSALGGRESGAHESGTRDSGTIAGTIESLSDLALVDASIGADGLRFEA